MKVGVLTGGGDAPGLNAVIRAVVRKCAQNGDELVGIREGWRGLLENKFESLDRNSVSGILHRGGTILATSRTNVYKEKDGEALVIKNMKEKGIDAIVAIGGEDTLGVASKLFKAGVNIVGVPKTIDRLHTTAEAHNRVIVVEVMGRHAGWIAIYSGIAGGADIILVPEEKYDLDEVCSLLQKRHQAGKNFSIVVASEGAIEKKKNGGLVLHDQQLDSFGHVHLGGIGNYLAEEIEKRTGYETRSTVLGHIQRGGTPTAFDRVLGTRLGVYAAELVHNKKWGYMAALKGTDIVAVKLEEATGELKTVNKNLIDVAATFFG